MKNIWISGSINSGKTTVSKILGKELKMAVIELDSFSEFVLNFMDFEEYVKLNYDIFPEVVEMYNKRGFGVIIVYPLGEEKYYGIKEKLTSFQIFTIDPTLEVSLQDRGERKLNDWERERIKYHYDKNIHNASFATRIDTKGKSPEETAKEIISKII
jgi:broad-specificity NMP kinase